MKTRMPIIMAVLFGVLVFELSVPQNAHAQGALRRLSSEMMNVTGTPSETLTNVPSRSGGTTVYTKTLMVPGGNTLYVNFHATADQHSGVGLDLRCEVDGISCNPEGGDVGASDSPPGWVTLGKHFNYDTTYTLPDGTTGLSAGDGGGGAGDMHDNAISYVWCVPNITSRVHTVTIKMGNSCGAGPTPCGSNNPIVFFEAAHIDIDVGQLPARSACVPLS